MTESRSVSFHGNIKRDRSRTRYIGYKRDWICSVTELRQRIVCEETRPVITNIGLFHACWLIQITRRTKKLSTGHCRSSWFYNSLQDLNATHIEHRILYALCCEQVLVVRPWCLLVESIKHYSRPRTCNNGGVAWFNVSDAIFICQTRWEAKRNQRVEILIPVSRFNGSSLFSY